MRIASQISGEPPVWGIGLTRTGTKSLNTALEILGYKSRHWPTTRSLLYGELSAATDESVAAVYKYLDFAFPDSKFILTEREETSWLASTAKHRQTQHEVLKDPAKFRAMAHAQALPVAEELVAGIGSSSPSQLFSQLVRYSLQADLGAQPGMLRDRMVEWAYTQSTLYGAFDFDREIFSQAYQKHEADVLQHFASRPEKLLRIRICEGEGWDKVCGFLGKDIPDVPFPHKHRGGVGD
jgi:sulfotransferase family protein